MRTVSAHTLAALRENLGTEPILVLGIEWVDGAEVLYSDQEITDTDQVSPTIVSVGSFDTALMVSGAGDSQSISITLDDVQGKLKEIFNTLDIHKRPVKVYHHFRGVEFKFKFLIFQGEINSPIVWNEGERSLTFTILTHTEDTEVAFSMEEGDFPSIPEEALGKVWPLVFGQVCNMEAVEVRSPRLGYLTAGEGWHDFTIHTRLCQARYIQCPTIKMGKTSTLTKVGSAYETTDEEQYGPDPECKRRRFEVICNLLYSLEQEESYEHDTLTIRGGNNFPQGEEVRLSIDGAILWGSFSGETFTVAGREHPDKATWEHDTCVRIQNHAYGPTLVPNPRMERTPSGSAWTVDPISLIGTVQPYESGAGDDDEVTYPDTIESLDDCGVDGYYWGRGIIGGPSASWDAYEDMESAGFVWKSAGTEVVLESDAEILHIVSLIPGTVDSVAAYKTMSDGRSLLMEVPIAYYTVYETDYDGYDVVEIGMDKKLSLRDSTWSDTLYVSFTSDVGPNPADVIEWLVDKYTALTCDATTFAAVHSSLTNYPSNFWVKARKNVLELIHDIAYQSRCALFIREDVVYITYLSAEPSSVRTLTESDILANSFIISLTETEDLITNHEISWSKTEARVNEAEDADLKFILKYNVPKYGVSKEAWHYYTQNTYSTILKSATFWLIRKSNSWKYVEFDAPLQHLDLDIFDCITLDVAQFSATPTKAIIEAAIYNPASNNIHFKCWTPILAGTDEEYLWAWPALQDAHLRWPLREDEDMAGAGYNFDVTPPVGHLLRSGYVALTDEDASVIPSSGDQNPSDSGDAAPTISCELSDFFDIEEDDPAFEALELAQSNRNVANEAAASEPATNYDNKEKKERTACGRPQYGDGCIYEVRVYYVTPHLLTSGAILGGCIGGPCREGAGSPCTGSIVVWCHTFSSFGSAWTFYHMKKAEIAQLHAECAYQTGKTDPYMVKQPKGIPDPDPTFGDGSCDDTDVSLPGETYAPREVGN